MTGFFKVNNKLEAEQDQKLDLQPLPPYVEIPQWYTYNKLNEDQIKRKPQSMNTVIDRVYGVNSLSGKRFYLRILFQ